MKIRLNVVLKQTCGKLNRTQNFAEQIYSTLDQGVGRISGAFACVLCQMKTNGQ